MEKPILFNTDMVKAILEGKKTCTRRIVKEKLIDSWNEHDEWQQNIVDGLNSSDTTVQTCGIDSFLENEKPYKVGDILYVRETWFIGDLLDEDESIKERGLVLYKADKRRDDIDYESIKWRPSIHMPKEAARIFLEVTNVRVERLEDITDEEALREGIQKLDSSLYGVNKNTDITKQCLYPKAAFSHLWDSTIKKDDIGAYSFKANPWVWVIEFKRIEK